MGCSLNVLAVLPGSGEQLWSVDAGYRRGVLQCLLSSLRAPTAAGTQPALLPYAVRLFAASSRDPDSGVAELARSALALATVAMTPRAPPVLSTAQRLGLSAGAGSGSGLGIGFAGLDLWGSFAAGAAGSILSSGLTSSFQPLAAAGVASASASAAPSSAAVLEDDEGDVAMSPLPAPRPESHSLSLSPAESLSAKHSKAAFTRSVQSPQLLQDSSPAVEVPGPPSSPALAASEPSAAAAESTLPLGPADDLLADASASAPARKPGKAAGSAEAKRAPSGAGTSTKKRPREEPPAKPAGARISKEEEEDGSRPPAGKVLKSRPGSVHDTAASAARRQRHQAAAEEQAATEAELSSKASALQLASPAGSLPSSPALSARAGSATGAGAFLTPARLPVSATTAPAEQPELVDVGPSDSEDQSSLWQF